MCGLGPAVIALETLKMLGQLSHCERVGYATSANVSGKPAARNAEQVQAQDSTIYDKYLTSIEFGNQRTRLRGAKQVRLRL